MKKSILTVAMLFTVFVLLSAASFAQRVTERKPPEKVSGSGGASLTAPQLAGARIFIKYARVFYPRIETRFEHLILFADGTALDAIPSEPVSNFDKQIISSLLDPGAVGTWKMEGAEKLVLTFPGDGSRTLRKHPRGWFDGAASDPISAADSAYEIYFPVIAPPKAKILGAWKNKSLVVYGSNGGGAAMVAGGSKGDWTFNADGTYSDGSESFTSATTTNMGSIYKGDGDVTQTGNRSRSGAGRWRLDGSLLSIERNGVVTVHFAFLMPFWTKNMANTDLMIDGERWTR